MGRGLQFSLRLAQKLPLISNSAGSYYFLPNGSTIGLAFASINAATEFSSLDVMFDEVFIHSLTLVHRCRNLNVQYTGTAANLQSCLGLVWLLPHNDPAYADASALIQTAVVTTQHKVIEVGRDWEFVAKNPTKFSWDSDVQDQSTAQAAMGWCPFGQVASKYGGLIYVGSALPSAAGATASAFAANTTIGEHFVYYDISVRARA